MTRTRARSPSDGPRTERDRSPEHHHSGGVRRAVGPVAPSLQMKPAVVGAAGDAFEKEADRAAEQVSQGKPSPALSPVSPQALQHLAQVPAVSADEVEKAGGVAQALFDEEEMEEEPIQAKGATSAGPRAIDVPRPGPGSPLQPATRSTLEGGLGADLGGVRVHDDQAARSTADAMGAKAFTQGSDISLGSGQSADDMGLMAHEAAHVVQQAGGSGTVQRAVAVDPKGTLPGGGKVDPDNKVVTIPTLKVPKTKYEKTSKDPIQEVPVSRKRDGTQQGDEWPKAVRKGGFADVVKAKLADPDVKKTKDDAGRYFLVNASAPLNPIIVTEDSLMELAMNPVWDEKGKPTRFQIDHRLEFQLGGADDDTNYWLLEEQANMSSGGMIQNQLAASMKDVFAAAKKAGMTEIPVDKGTARAAGWKFSVAEVSKEHIKPKGREDSNWELADVQKGKPLESLRHMKDTEMEAAGGTAAEIVLFMGPTGGHRQVVKWGKEAEGKGELVPPAKWWFRLNSRAAAPANNNFKVTSIKFDPKSGGMIIGTLFKENKKKKTGIKEVPDKTIPILVHPNFQWTGFLAKEKFLNEARTELDFEGASPIELDKLDLAPDKGLVARGRLLPTVPLIDKAQIDVVVDGDDVYLSKLFTAEDFTFPGPIKVGACSLELQFGTKGLAILGEANFEIQSLGTGRVYAMARADLDEVGFALGGEFDFLSDLFDPARVEVWYKDGELGGKGELGIKEGKVKGLKSAQVTAEFGKEGIRANGTFATTIPGVESGTLAFAYKEDGTVELGGTLNLGAKVPGISSGSVEAQLVRHAEGGWKVFGKIQAVPSIPGIASQITGTYEDGAIQIETTVAYARGMAAGQLVIGVSNRPIDATSGKPVGGPGAELSAYGGGQVALTLAPWLRATAGLRLLPNGEIEVTGQIGLPEALEIFPRKSLDKELFKVGIDIPIIAFTVAGQRVGIFATVQGGAQLLAHFGPAELKELNLGVTWNPDHEDETTVKGHAALALPAGAGVKLFIKGGLGVGIPVVSATLGLTIGGYLGIAAEVRAAVDIDWTPARGMVLDAVAAASAEPKFIFSVMGFVSVDLDLWLKTINLYEKQWMLAAFEYGSGLRLGISLPVHYEEGKDFEPSLSDVTFEVPDIDPLDLLSDLVDHVV